MKRKSNITTNTSRCQNSKDNQLFKLFVNKWAGSIMANASRCRREHVGSILTQSTATKSIPLNNKHGFLPLLLLIPLIIIGLIMTFFIVKFIFDLLILAVMWTAIVGFIIITALVLFYIIKFMRSQRGKGGRKR